MIDGLTGYGSVGRQCSKSKHDHGHGSWMGGWSRGLRVFSVSLIALDVLYCTLFVDIDRHVTIRPWMYSVRQAVKRVSTLKRRVLVVSACEAVVATVSCSFILGSKLSAPARS